MAVVAAVAVELAVELAAVVLARELALALEPELAGASAESQVDSCFAEGLASVRPASERS